MREHYIKVEDLIHRTVKPYESFFTRLVTKPAKQGGVEHFLHVVVGDLVELEEYTKKHPSSVFKIDIYHRISFRTEHGQLDYHDIGDETKIDLNIDILTDRGCTIDDISLIVDKEE